MLPKSGSTAAVGLTLALLLAGPAAAHVHHHHHHLHPHGKYGASSQAGCQGKAGGHDRDNNCDWTAGHSIHGSSSRAPAGTTRLNTNRAGGHDRDNGGKAQ